jgi:hypothetical protein
MPSVGPNDGNLLCRRPRPRSLDPGLLDFVSVAARAIGTSDRALEALIKQGHIKAPPAVNPISRCPQTLVSNEETAKFKATYVSLWALSKERGVYIATLKKRLDRAGAKPAFDPAKIGARSYESQLLAK